MSFLFYYALVHVLLFCCSSSAFVAHKFPFRFGGSKGHERPSSSSSSSSSSMTAIDTTTPTSDEHTTPTIRCKVAIIGAGAAGLMCAHELLANPNNQKDREGNIGATPSVVILEARDRIGGRIHSETRTVRTVTGEHVELVVDHGAAWVHGIGYDWPTSAEQQQPPIDGERVSTKEIQTDSIRNAQENPMMTLLQQVTPPGEHVSSLLHPVFRGNPWMRPSHVLYNNNLTSTASVYVAGRRLDTEADSRSIQKALTRHFQIMHDVSQVGNAMFDSGKESDTIHQSLQETIDDVTAKNSDSSNNRKECDEVELLIDTLTPLYQHLVENWYACPASELQLYEFTRDDDNHDDGILGMDATYRGEGDFYGPHCTLRNGMKTVLEPLLNHGVPECIKFNQEVVKIRHHNCTDDTVELQCQTGLQVQADICIVTLPMGCLKEAINSNSMFQPPLSSGKRDAVNSFRMGGYKKVFLTFDRIFWPVAESMLCLVRKMSADKDSQSLSEIGNYLLCYNVWAKDGIPCIEAVLCGRANDWAVNKSDEVIRDAVMAFMEESMGEDSNGIHGWCLDCHITRWEEDRLSGYGAYSSFNLGTGESHSDAIRGPEWNNKLIFAGEATVSEHEGSVHAALMSGTRAAETVKEMISN